MLDFERSLIDGDISVYKEYCNDINEYSNSQFQKIKNRLEDLTSKTPEAGADIYDHFSSEYEMYSTRYIELANNGSLLISYSFFENRIKSISRYINQYLVIKQRVYTHTRGLSFAENLRNDIYWATGLDFTSLDTIWANLDKYRKIRNVIVHNGANLFEEEFLPLINQKNYSLISSITQIEINRENGDFYIKDKRFVLDYLDMIDDYFKKLFSILKQLNPNDIN